MILTPNALVTTRQAQMYLSKFAISELVLDVRSGRELVVLAVVPAGVITYDPSTGDQALVNLSELESDALRTLNRWSQILLPPVTIIPVRPTDRQDNL